LGRWDEASTALEWARRFDLEGINAEMVHQWGLELAAVRGESDLAERDAAQIVGLSSFFADSMLRGFGEFALWQGRPSDARDILDQGLAIMDHRPDTGVTLVGPACWLRLRAEADLVAGRRGASPVDSVIEPLLRRIEAAMDDARRRRPNHVALAD